MKKLEFHPIANIFPLMEGESFGDLFADIKSHGVHEQGVIYEGKLLDGRNRYLACQKAKIDFPVRKFDKSIDGDSPLAFVLSANLHRRHLTTSQRAMVAAGIANLERGKSKSNAQKCAFDLPPISQGKSKSNAQKCAFDLPPISQGDAAKILGVSSRSVQQAAAVKEGAPVTVRDAVSAGEVSVADAAAISDLPRSEQTAALKKVESGKAKTLRAAVADKPRPSGKQTKDPRKWEKWHSLFGQLKRATDDVNRDFPHGNLSRQIHNQLNGVEALMKEWRRALR